MALRPVPQGPLHQHSSPATSDLAALAQHPRGEERAPRRLGAAGGPLPPSPAGQRAPEQVDLCQPAELPLRQRGCCWGRGLQGSLRELCERGPRGQAGEQVLRDVRRHGEDGREVRQRPGADAQVVGAGGVGEEPVHGEVRHAARVEERRRPLGKGPVLLPEPALARGVGRQEVRLVRGHPRDARSLVAEVGDIALVLLQFDELRRAQRCFCGRWLVTCGIANHSLTVPDSHEMLCVLLVSVWTDSHDEVP
mmetsp:Transcript_70033/g.204917  ORF Transcript_70033/g.204917 Transcript_70033/m.204917 type:complete len:251 (-) Transcript_70033:400-1152(-)